ncbi:MAG TPA: amidohydrolase family protein [Sedimentisphaerales bacterium]|nr:amidohydrolase family protein [Sedimentisphaerales bacterium]
MGKKHIRHVVLMLVFALAISVMFVTSPLSAAEEVTAIRGGDLYTITGGIIKNGTILIRGGKISDIGQNIEIPEKAKVIDASGKVVMPGLVAVNAEVGVIGYPDITKIADSLDPFEFSVSLALASGITTAMVSAGRPSGDNPIGGATAVIKTFYGDLDQMLVKESVVQSVMISNRDWLRKTTFKQNLRKAQSYLRKLAAYQQAGDKKKAEEPKKPDGLDAYIRLLRREVPAVVAASTTGDILAALEFVDEFGIRMILTGAIEAWIVAEEIARRDVRVVITPRQKQRPNEDISGPSGSTLENAAILKKAGVKFAIIPPSTYFGTGGIAGRDMMALPMEAAFAVSGGLDEQTALESITMTAAEIIGVSDRVGSLQVGKDADIIILDGHPFHHKTFVETTLINGTVLYEKSKSIYFSHITNDE